MKTRKPNMARKAHLRSEVSSSIRFDSRTSTVMAEATHDNIKEKVQAVREVVPGKSNNEVVLVLQYYDYSVERAIQAYVEDGAKAALHEWNFTGSKQPNKKRKNRKKGNGDKVGNKPDSTPVALSSQSFQEDTAVTGKTSLPNGDIVHDNQSEEQVPVALSRIPPMTSMDVSDTTVSSSSVSSTVPSSSPSSRVEVPLAADPQPQQQSHTKTPGHGDSHHHQRQYSPRERTLSELSTGSGMGDSHHKKPHQGLEKAIKDLHRQTTSLERLRLLLDHEIDRSIKSMKSVFEELRQGLNNREAQLMAEMDLLKTEASDMLEMRQAKANELKRQVDRSDRLKDSEITELRAEIKHFVSERRHDEDLGHTTRFLYDSDHMLAEFSKFGEVVHVKSLYTARKASVSSVASSGISQEGNHDEDISHSQEVSELQDRLKYSLRLQNTQNRGHSSNRRLPSTQNGPSNSGNNSSRPPGSPAPPSLASVNTRNYIQSGSSRGRPSYNSSNTGSPGRGGRDSAAPRGRGRGRGGRGGQHYEGDRPPSSQGRGIVKAQSYSNEGAAVRSST